MSIKIKLNASLVSPRETLKSCLLSNAASFICLHVHPSGSLNPSVEDRDVTRRLMEAGDILGVKMLDHLIVGGGSGRVFSFRSEGLLDQLRPKRRDWERC